MWWCGRIEYGGTAWREPGGADGTPRLLWGQEELAFVFEMLQQFEDALVQYDELDALFSQYVVNFGAGGE